MEPRNLKRVLIHSIVFSPDGVSTAYLYNDIALGLVDNGFDVVVLTTIPHYNIIQAEFENQPLSKKIFSEKQNACPKGKWDDVDFKYFSENKQKNII